MQTSATLELLIQRQLAENPNMRLKVVLDQLQNEELSLLHVKLLARLFTLGGERQRFNDWLLEKLKANQKFPVPWGQWLEFFKNANLPTAVKKAFIVGAERQGEFKSLARSRILDEFEPELGKTFTEQKKQLEKKSNIPKKEFSDDLALVDSQKVQISSQRDNLEKANSEASFRLENIDWRLRPTFSAEDQSLLQNWLSEFIKESASHLENPKTDLIYFFKFLDAPELALQLIDSLEEKSLLLLEIKAELLLEARRYIELLEFIDTLLPQIKSESSFELLYLRSQALWHAGLKDDAIVLLEAIAQARPDYKLSQVLLAEWKGEF